MAEIVTFTLRLPAALHADLKELAGRDLRSLHAEILYLLQRAAEDRREELDRASKKAA